MEALPLGKSLQLFHFNSIICFLLCIFQNNLHHLVWDRKCRLGHQRKLDLLDTVFQLFHHSLTLWGWIGRCLYNLHHLVWDRRCRLSHQRKLDLLDTVFQLFHRRLAVPVARIHLGGRLKLPQQPQYMHCHRSCRHNRRRAWIPWCKWLAWFCRYLAHPQPCTDRRRSRSTAL